MQSQLHIVNLIGLAIDGSGKASRQAIWDTVQDEFGLQKLGAGSYGAVFRHPTDYNLVIKVGYDKEDGWLDYAAFCMMHRPGNPELMEVHDLRIFRHCFVAVMERLETAYNNADVQYLRRNWREGTLLTPKLEELYLAVGPFYDLHEGNIMQRNGQAVIVDPVARGSKTYHKYMTGNGRIDVTMRAEPVVRGIDPDYYKHADLADIDYAGLEKRVMDWRIKFDPMLMQQIPKRRDHIGRREWMVPYLGIPKVGDQVLIQLKNRDIVHEYEPIPRERALVVKDGTPASIRSEKEDRMLRVRSQHDNTAYTQGVQRSLLPFSRSRRVQAARIALVEGTARATECIERHAGWASKFTYRFHPKHPAEQDAVAAQGGDRV